MDKLYKTIDKEKIEDREAFLKSKRENKKTLGKLFGMRLALEDNISTKGMLTSAGAKMLENYIPPFDAFVVEKILEEDGIIAGKIDTREFGVAREIDSNMGRVIVEGGADISIGVDASGEIRNIATSAGLYGLKPSYGSVSRYGVIGSAPSLEQVGIISKDIESMKKVFDSISGKDKRDSTSFEKKKMEAKDIKKIKIGIIKGDMESLSESIKEEIDKSLKIFKELHSTVKMTNIPSAKYVPSVFNILQSAEFSSDMGKFDGVAYGYKTKEYSDNEDFFKKNRTIGFSEEVKKKIMFGNFVLGKGNYEDYYEKSQKIRTLMTKELDKKFEEYDIILSPIVGEDSDYTLLANIAGKPAISLPSISKGKKLGLQIMADSFQEELLFKLAEAYEKEVLKSKKEVK